MDTERHEPFYPEQKPESGKLPSKYLTGSAGITVAIGLAMVGMAMYYFRARPSPPEIVEVPSEPHIEYRDKLIPSPPEVRIEPPPLTPALPELPEAEVIPSSWDGIWRRDKYPIPLFQFLPTPEGTTGNLIGNWSPIIPFKVGSAEDDRIEFFVQDDIFRVHFRFVLKDRNKAEVFGWVTDEDWVIAFVNGTKKVKTPQQAALVRIVMEGNGMQAQTIFRIGVFERREELRIGKPRPFPGIVIPAPPVIPFVPVTPPQPPVVIPRIMPNRGGMPLPHPPAQKKPNPPPKPKDHKGRGGHK